MMAVAKPTDEKTFKDMLAIDHERVVIVKFGTCWCRPCADMQPAFESLAADLHNDGYNATLVEIDRDDLQDVFDEYDIRKMPTFKTFARGNVVNTIQALSADELRSELRASLPSPSLLLDADF